MVAGERVGIWVLTRDRCAPYPGGRVPSGDVLTPLPRRLAPLLRGLPEADGLALAGGAARIVRRLVDRTTRDLDYFATDAAAVDVLLPVLEARLAAEGLSSARRRQAPGFVRLEVYSEAELLELARRKDAGFDLASLRDRLSGSWRAGAGPGAVGWLRRGEYPPAFRTVLVPPPGDRVGATEMWG